ncbi:MAG: Alkaline serine exoprotease A precursor [uncultured Gemmatimonadetes bacterium]|uniref:Alkaline serine exoprotease A n=1 Tax=uncultured Gemmatimonadota bacterium TaxID=203437 RepID=A0A6J4MIS1_9BACT|nr:MAG: Alkaline serine exoprotease A precursor [uncultured Gemmatimonadota bacterium]
MKRTTYALASLLALAACGEQAAPTAAVESAPVLSRSADGSYIVVLNDGADPRSVAAVAGVSPRFVYTAALNGFAATLNAGQLNALQNNPNVSYIDGNQAVHASTTQLNATWGLDRTDQRALPLNTSFSYTNTGVGVNAYILDTGIRFSHAEFVGRVSSGFDAIDGGTADDCNGHGTHVAGTVGGTLYGIAKGVNLVGVRVLDCAGSGSTAGVIAGIDWVTANHVKPAVANMSLGGGASTSLDDAVRRSIAAGVTYAIAAGNGNIFGIAQDACKSSPARVAEAITIGATTKTDAKTSWSNYGACVDFFAPGASITSAWYTGDAATNTISGTSMATPHVAGVAALYLQSNPGAAPAAVRTALYDATTKGIVTSSKTANNHLLFSAF